METYFDLAIIGAGIIGAHCFILASQTYPHWNIILLDKNLIGRGASFYSAGVDVPIGRNEWHTKITQRSRIIYEQYTQQLPNLPLKSIETIWIVPQNKISEFKNRICVGKPELENADKNPSLKNINFIFHDKEVFFSHAGNSVGDVYAITTLLIRNALSRKTNTCIEGFEVHSIKYRDPIFSIWSKEGYEIRAKRVITALGPWPNFIISDGDKHNVKKIVALHIDMKPQKNDPLLFFYESGNFLLPLYEKGYWLLSINSLDWNCNPQEEQLNIHSDELALGKAFLAKYVPDFASKIAGGRVFCDSYADNRIPVITTLKDSITISGCSGSGYRLAPGLAETALSFFQQ